MFSLFKSKTKIKPIKKVGETMQYLIVRQDLQMSPGKMSAQCSHASSGIALAFYSESKRRIVNYEKLNSYRDAMHCWQTRSFGKVVLRVKSRDQLLKICQSLDKEGIPYCPIFDACRTELEPEEPNGSVFTCIGLSPIFRDEVPKFIKKLQVFQ